MPCSNSGRYHLSHPVYVWERTLQVQSSLSWTKQDDLRVRLCLFLGWTDLLRREGPLQVKGILPGGAGCTRTDTKLTYHSCLTDCIAFKTSKCFTFTLNCLKDENGNTVGIALGRLWKIRSGFKGGSLSPQRDAPPDVQTTGQTSQLRAITNK